MNKSNTSTSSTNDTGKKDAIVEQAKHAVTHVADQAKEQVSNQLNSQFDSRKDKAVETMSNVADAIRGTSEKLKGVGPLGDVAERAAAGIENVADFFEGKKIGDIVRDVERFARREPALFLGATFALGLIGGRFLKSSGHRSAGGGASSARAGGGLQSERAAAYGGSYADEYGSEYLQDDDLEDADTMRFGTYGNAAGRSGGQTRGPSNTLPMGSRTGSSPTATRTGSSAMGSTNSASPQGLSSSGASTPGTYSTSTAGTSSTSPSTSAASPSTSPSTSSTSTTSPSTPPLTSSASKGGSTPGSV